MYLFGVRGATLEGVMGQCAFQKPWPLRNRERFCGGSLRFSAEITAKPDPIPTFIEVGALARPTAAAETVPDKAVEGASQFCDEYNYSCCLTSFHPAA